MDMPLGAIADAAGKAIDLAKIREGRANTDAMQANATAEVKAEIAADATAAVAADDLPEIQRQAAE